MSAFFVYVLANGNLFSVDFIWLIVGGVFVTGSANGFNQIIEAKTDFIDKIGLKDHLSPNRANGLSSMIKQLKIYALAYQTKINQ